MVCGLWLEVGVMSDERENVFGVQCFDMIFSTIYYFRGKTKFHKPQTANRKLFILK